MGKQSSGDVSFCLWRPLVAETVYQLNVLTEPSN